MSPSRNTNRRLAAVLILVVAPLVGRLVPWQLSSVGITAAAATATRGALRWRPADPPGHATPRPLERRARHRTIAAAYPDAVELVVLSVRAGYSGIDALRAVLPHVQPTIGMAFAEVIARADRGTRFADALAGLTAALGPDAAALADTLAAAERHGLPLAPVLERLADEARRQRRRRADALARQLPVRLAAPLVLCTLPSFVLLAVAPMVLSAISSLQW